MANAVGGRHTVLSRVSLKPGAVCLELFACPGAFEAFGCAPRQLKDLLVSLPAGLRPEHVASPEHRQGHEFHFCSWLRADETAALMAVAVAAPPTTPSVTLAARRTPELAVVASKVSSGRSPLALRVKIHISFASSRFAPWVGLSGGHPAVADCGDEFLLGHRGAYLDSVALTDVDQLALGQGVEPYSFAVEGLH